MSIYQIKCEGVPPFKIDPAIAANDDVLKAMIAVSMPEVGNATITRHPEKDGVVMIELVKKAGTKGGQAGYLTHLIECPGGINSAQALYQELSTLNLMAMSAEEVIVLDGRITKALEESGNAASAMEAAANRLRQSAGTASPYPVLM